jgi:hypothetical protein
MIEPKESSTFIQKNCWYLVVGLVGAAVVWWDLEPKVMDWVLQRVPLGQYIKPLPTHLRH